MANTSKSGLDNLVKAVLGVGNQEQNLFWPPHIISSQINVVTSLLLDKLVTTYPENVDSLLPFMANKKIPVTSGYVQLPPEYRNLLGSPSISVTDDGEDCNSPVVIDTEREFEIAKLKSGCKTRPLVIVDKGKWDYLVTSSYAFPTYKDPIGMFIGSKRIKVCPYDLKVVDVTYCVKENIYKYGYIMQPDDTFIFDAATSQDTQWEDAAFSKLFTAMLALYSAWSRDNTLTDWSRVLHGEGIL